MVQSEHDQDKSTPSNALHVLKLIIFPLIVAVWVAIVCLPPTCTTLPEDDGQYGPQPTPSLPDIHLRGTETATTYAYRDSRKSTALSGAYSYEETNDAEIATIVSDHYETVAADLVAEATQRALDDPRLDNYYDNLIATIDAEQRMASAWATIDALPVFERYECLHWSEANMHLEEETCVYGEVVYTLQSGQYFYIAFTYDTTAFYAVLADPVDESLQGNCITVFGTIQNYEGRPRICVWDLSQLEYCYP
jgi:hypothetical protein